MSRNLFCQSRPTPTKPAMRPGLRARTGRLRANAPGSGRRSAWDVDLSLGKSELLSKIVAQQTTDLIVRQRRNIAFRRSCKQVRGTGDLHPVIVRPVSSD